MSINEWWQGGVFARIATSCTEYNPMGIGIDNGEEYDPQVQTICERLDEATTEEKLAEIIQEEFENWFLVGTMDSTIYRNIANHCWEYVEIGIMENAQEELKNTLDAIQIQLGIEAVIGRSLSPPKYISKADVLPFKK